MRIDWQSEARAIVQHKGSLQRRQCIGLSWRGLGPKIKRLGAPWSAQSWAAAFPARTFAKGGRTQVSGSSEGSVAYQSSMLRG